MNPMLPHLASFHPPPVMLAVNSLEDHTLGILFLEPYVSGLGGVDFGRNRIKGITGVRPS